MPIARGLGLATPEQIAEGDQLGIDVRALLVPEARDKIRVMREKMELDEGLKIADEKGIKENVFVSHEHRAWKVLKILRVPTRVGGNILTLKAVDSPRVTIRRHPRDVEVIKNDEAPQK